VEATVDQVASESRDGKVRVELAVIPSPTLRVALRHGMPGTVEIEVERKLPSALVLRMAGQWVTGAKAIE